jgi:hypothetical protein
MRCSRQPSRYPGVVASNQLPTKIFRYTDMWESTLLDLTPYHPRAHGCCDFRGSEYVFLAHKNWFWQLIIMGGQRYLLPVTRVGKIP